MLHWESVKSEFAWEGSWRDIYVLDVDLDGWRTTVQTLVSRGFHGPFMVDGVNSKIPLDVSWIFEPGREAIVR